MPAKYISRQAKTYINDRSYKPAKVIAEASMYLPEHADGLEPGSLRHLAVALGTDAGCLSRIQNKRTAFTPYVILAILELTGWTLDQFKNIAGIKTIMRY